MRNMNKIGDENDNDGDDVTKVKCSGLATHLETLLRRLCRLCPDPNGFFSASVGPDATLASSLAAVMGPRE